MRARAKAILEVAGARSGVARVLRYRTRTRRLVLAYHNVVPRGESPWGERTLHIPLERFMEHLDVLAETCTLVPLEALLDERPNDTGRPMVAITFDDAYQGAVFAGAEELLRRGVPATFFASPGLAGEEGFWWDRTAEPRGGWMPPELRRHCLTRLQGRQETILEWARREGRSIPSSPVHARAAEASQLEALVRTRSLTIGSHTWSHPNLAVLPPADRAREIDRGMRWVAALPLGGRRWLAYPYGIATAPVRSDALAAGHAGGFRVEGGWLPNAPRDAFALPRLAVPAHLSANGLRLRIAGVRVR